MAKAVAWIAILVASNLTNILWRTTLHSEVPLWTLAVRIGILVLLLGLSLSLPGLRSLRGYLVALVALSAGFLLEDLIYQNGTLVAWIAAAPWRDPVIVSSTLKFLLRRPWRSRCSVSAAVTSFSSKVTSPLRVGCPS